MNKIKISFFYLFNELLNYSKPKIILKYEYEYNLQYYQIIYFLFDECLTII